MMRWCKASAMVLLAVVAMLAAAPALACVAVEPNHACCKGMMPGMMPQSMQDDSDTAAMAQVNPRANQNNSCCDVRMPASTVPVERTVTAETQSNVALVAPAWADLAVNAVPDVACGLSVAKAPPHGFSGSISILRI